MAAEADLVLSSVHPFRSEEVESYKCTGYRYSGVTLEMYGSSLSG